MNQLQLNTAEVLDTLDQRERLEVDEAVVSLCLNPLYVPDVSDKNVRQWAARALLRTGSIFVVDAEAAELAFASAAEMPLLEFPPLPFPRVLIEGRDEDGPCPLFTIIGLTGKGAEIRMNVFVLGIHEHEPGAVWDVCVAASFHGLRPVLMRAALETLGPDANPDARSRLEEAAEAADSGHAIQYARIRPTEVVAGEDWRAMAREVGIEELEQFPGLDSFAWLIPRAITAAHLIVAEGVPHEQMTVPRAQRRERQRRYGVEHPSVYFVDLARAGERRRGGVSERSYRVRWLVRGHWRLSDTGSTLVARKGGLCSWVKPYIKGPVGAPWKGRPVHRIDDRDDSPESLGV